MRVAGGKAAGQEYPRPQPRVHGEIDAVEHFGLLAAQLVHERDDVVARDAELGRDNIVQAAHLKPAAVGEARIGWRLEAVLLKVSGGDVEVVGRREMTLRAAEKRQLRRDTRH